MLSAPVSSGFVACLCFRKVLLFSPFNFNGYRKRFKNSTNPVKIRLLAFYLIVSIYIIKLFNNAHISISYFYILIRWVTKFATWEVL